MPPTTTPTQIPEIIRKYQAEILKDWNEQQQRIGAVRSDLIKESTLREDSQKVLDGLVGAAATDAGLNSTNAGYEELKGVLGDISRARAKLGFTPLETAAFVFSLREPIQRRLTTELAKDPSTLFREMLAIAGLIDQLGLYTTEVYQKAREEVIARQQQELMELSTPVVQLWEGVLALPLIGTLDSGRTQVVMENLLQEIVRTGAGIAIIDITGVPTVDTLVAQHLMKTVAAARLMGADCIISGIRAQIAQTIVHLGVDLKDVITKASIADALRIAMQRNGYTIVKARSSALRAGKVEE